MLALRRYMQLELQRHRREMAESGGVARLADESCADAQSQSPRAWLEPTPEACPEEAVVGQAVGQAVDEAQGGAAQGGAAQGGAGQGGEADGGDAAGHEKKDGAAAEAAAGTRDAAATNTDSDGDSFSESLPSSGKAIRRESLKGAFSPTKGDATPTPSHPQYSKWILRPA